LGPLSPQSTTGSAPTARAVVNMYDAQQLLEEMPQRL